MLGSHTSFCMDSSVILFRRVYMKPIFKRLLSGVLSSAMTVSAIPIVSAHAEESTQPFPYTMFAASNDEGAITVNAGNFCVNGNLATNGTIISSCNMNINGTKTENADESMIFILDKIDNHFFSVSNIEEHNEDYTLDELNININVPTEVQGEATLTGNININNALKALDNVNLYGYVKNTNDSVIFSKYGDIVIDSQNVNLNGLVYAPFGSVTINAQNLNLNNAVIIAKSIVLSCPNINANNCSNVSSFVGTTSEALDIPLDEFRYMKDQNGNGLPDFFEDKSNWSLCKDANFNGVPDCIESEITEESEKELFSYDDLEIEFAEGNTYSTVVQDVIFPSTEYEDATVVWESYNTEIIDNNGKVNRPNSEKEIVNVVAHITYDDETTEDKEFELTVWGIPSYNTNELIDYTLDDINLLNPNSEIEYQVNEYGNLQSYYGKYSVIPVHTVEDAINSLYNVKTLTGLSDPRSEIKPVSVITNGSMSIYKFVQVYNGIPVYDSIFTVATNNKAETSFLLSDYKPINTNISTSPSIAKESAINTICSLSQYISIIPNDEDHPDLYMYSFNGETNLVWSINLFLSQSLNNAEAGYYEILVDAHSNEIIYITASGENETKTGTVKKPDLENIQREIKYTIHDGWINDYVQLIDRGRKIYINSVEIETLADDSREAIYSYGLTENWTQEHVSAMYNAEATYDYYKGRFSRKSYNNKSGRINIMLNKYLYDNSMQTTGGNIIMGFNTASDRHLTSCARGLDTLGHEFTHAVVQNETNLIYAGTGGAINEGYADIFGNYIDASNYLGVPDWSHGNHQMLSGIGFRDLANPNNSGNPAQFGDAYFQDYKADSSDHYGVHTNGSLLPRATYLMQCGDAGLGISPISDPDLVQDIWYYSLCMGYTSKTDFYDVRNNVLQAAKNLGMSSSDIATIEKVFDEVNIKKSNSDEGKNYFKNNWKYYLNSIFGETYEYSTAIYGKTLIADSDVISSNNSPLSNVSINLTKPNGEELNSFSSNSNGDYVSNYLITTDIVLNYTKNGYLTEKQYVYYNNDTDFYYCSDVEMIPATLNGNGVASGYIKDSISTSGVSGLTLNIRNGLNNRSFGEPIKTIVTSSNGAYSVTLPAGHYCIEIVDNRSGINTNDAYNKTYFNIKVVGNATINGQNGVVSNKLNDNQLRIVLTWDMYPYDLDSHLIGPTKNGGQFHISYTNKQYRENGDVVANLDVDDVDSYGPETTTIYNPINGTYSFYVYNYSGNPSINVSNAKVVVYVGNSNIPSYVFNVPTSGSGRTWNVFKYQSATKSIIPVNEIS